MSRSNAAVELESDMAVVGFGQRVASSIFLVFGLILSVILFSNQSSLIWYLPAAAWPTLLFLLSWRIGMRLESDVLVIRGHFRTTRLPLSDIHYAVAVPHGGFWVGYGGALPGIWQVDIRMDSGRSPNFPATMMRRARARRIEAGINELADLRGRQLQAGDRSDK